MKKQLLLSFSLLTISFVTWSQDPVFNNASEDNNLYSNTGNWINGVKPGDNGRAQFNGKAQLDESVTLSYLKASVMNAGLLNGAGTLTLTGGVQSFVDIQQFTAGELLFDVPIIYTAVDPTGRNLFRVDADGGVISFGPNSDLDLSSTNPVRLQGFPGAGAFGDFNFDGVLRGAADTQFGINVDSVFFGETSDNSNYVGTLVYFSPGVSVIANTADNGVMVASGKKIQVNNNNGTLTLNGANIYKGSLSVAGTNSFRMEVNKNQPSMETLNLDAATLTLAIGSDVSMISFNAVSWTTGTLTIENFQNGVLKFGSTSDALTAAQLSQIDIGGGTVYLDAKGYLLATTSRVWDGLNWSFSPIASDNAVMAASYAAGNLEVNDLTIQSGATVSIASGEVLKINGDLINQGTLNIASGGSLVTLGNTVGDASISRNTVGSDGYSIVGSPVTGATLDNLITQGANFLYDYDGSAYVAVTTGDMMPGKGYFVAMAGEANPSATFTGSIVSGDVAANVSGAGDGFTILANPYAAPITAADIITSDVANQATTGSIYIWDDGGSNDGSLRAGTYRVANNTTSDFTTIGSVQGFYVQSNNGGGDITFTSAMQDATASANVDGNYYRSESKQTIKLSISGNGLFHETVIGLTPEATNERDYGLDAQYLKGNDLISFYSSKDDVKFASLGLPLVDSEPTEISLGMDLAEAGTYSLSIDEFSGFGNDQVVTLIDQVTGNEYKLTADFTINISTNPVAESNRFKIVVSPSKVLSVDDLKNDIRVFGTASSLIVNFESNAVENVSIISLDGRMIFNEKVSFSENKANISTKIKSNTIYIMRVNDRTVKFLVKAL